MDKSPEITDAASDANTNTSAPQVGAEKGVYEAKGVDGALKYANNDGRVILAGEDKSVLRKIDLHMMPWMCALYFLQFLDKQTLAYSSVMGIQAYANLSSNQYSWLGSIYYLGYLVAAYPHNRALQQFNHVTYLSVCATLWGITLCCMAACHNFAGLMTVRALLGAFEAVVSPAFLLITAKWYKKYEHGSRVGLWAACNGLASGLGGVIAYGCYRGQTDGDLAFPAWKILVLVAGGMTVVYAVSMHLFMANTPADAPWLSEDEKVVAIERLRDNHQGLGSQQFKWPQFREAFTDIRTWCYVLFILTTQIPLAGTTLFSSLLIKSLGFPSGTTLLLALPGGALQVMLNPGWGFLADRIKQRSLVTAGAQLLNVFAIALQVGLAERGLLFARGGQLTAYFIIAGNGAVSFFLCLSMVSSNTLGTTKKTTVNAVVFVTMAVSYLVGPQIFVNPPFYTGAKAATLALWAVGFVIMIGIWHLNKQENARRDRAEAAGDVQEVENVEFLDLTDKQNKKFRYVL